jgi:hypothetical protein
LSINELGYEFGSLCYGSTLVTCSVFF